MAKAGYIRTDSDCVCIRSPEGEEKSGYGICEALAFVHFQRYVFMGQCGTEECPFYKQKKLEVKRDPGNLVACMR